MHEDLVETQCRNTREYQKVGFDACGPKQAWSSLRLITSLCFTRQVGYLFPHRGCRIAPQMIELLQNYSADLFGREPVETSEIAVPTL